MHKDELQLKIFMCVIQSRQVVRTAQSTAGEASPSNMIIPKLQPETETLQRLGTVDDPNSVGHIPILET
ncbi:hypothetical protein LEMLEM_LOCUS10576, partial [Lemmus lemmus]